MCIWMIGSSRQIWVHPGRFSRLSEFPCAASCQGATSSGVATKSELTPTRFPCHWHALSDTRLYNCPLLKMNILDHWRWAPSISAEDMHRMIQNHAVHSSIGAQQQVTYLPNAVVGIQGMAPNYRGLVLAYPGSRMGFTPIGLMGFPSGLPRFAISNVWNRFNALRFLRTEWPEFRHVDVSWPPSELISPR